MNTQLEPVTCSNTANIIGALDFLYDFVKTRARSIRVPGTELLEHDNPNFRLVYHDDSSALGSFIKQQQPTPEEYVILLLALAPHVKPDLLGKAIAEAISESGSFPELGGQRDIQGRGFLPTGETALFLLAGEDIEQRFAVQKILSSDHWLAKQNILRLEPAGEGEPYWSGRLMLESEYIELFTLGKISNPMFGASFPAQEISTQLEWDDLVLNEAVMEQIDELRQWMVHHQTMMKEWGLGKRLKPGYRALFYGPPGTGKTLTATLLGKYTDLPVYRIDLSIVVSKYIGETEKNLANLFDKAHSKKWILFFDEADALFGKRTNVKDAHDRYANQEVSYLLQRVEEFNGLVILASNFKANLDEAFLRRFNAIIRFPIPNETERIAIWRKAFPENVRFDDGDSLVNKLGQFEITGGNIINVVQYACIDAISRKSETIRKEAILKGIQREVEKEGKIYQNVF